MKYTLLRILKTHRFYILSAIMIGATFLCAFAFCGKITQRIELIKTWDKFEAISEGMDVAPLQSDSYGYFGKDVYIKSQKDSKSIWNVNVYQYLPEQEYGKMSPVNADTVISGQFGILQKNEIAISSGIAQKYSLKVDDVVYLKNGMELTIRFIFEEIYEIYRVNYTGGASSVFLGVDTIDISKGKCYANFQSADFHNELYLISQFPQEAKKEVKKWFLSVGIIVLVVCAALTLLFRTRKEKRLFHNLRVSGYRKIWADAVIFELAYTWIPIIVICGLLLLIKAHWMLITISCLPIAIIGLINSIYCLIGVK